MSTFTGYYCDRTGCESRSVEPPQDKWFTIQWTDNRTKAVIVTGTDEEFPPESDLENFCSFECMTVVLRKEFAPR